MRRALAQLLPVDHRSIEKRNYKQRDNNERPNYRNVRFSVSSSAFFSVIAVSLVWFTSFYGNDGAKFSQYDSARHKLLPGGEFDRLRNEPMLAQNRFFWRKPPC